VIVDAADANGAPVRRVELTTVRLGATRGDLVVVEEGLAEGQQVASSGIFKLSNGTAVVVNDALAPVAVAAPSPSQS
jgi:membrane fusion protein (multidrug efflux system)